MSTEYEKVIVRAHVRQSQYFGKDAAQDFLLRRQRLRRSRFERTRLTG